MKEVWMVILGKSHQKLIEGTSNFTPYADLYRLYENLEDAIAWARENGYESPLLVPPSDKVGRATFYKCGDVDVTLMKQIIR